MFHPYKRSNTPDKRSSTPVPHTPLNTQRPSSSSSSPASDPFFKAKSIARASATPLSSTPSGRRTPNPLSSPKPSVADMTWYTSSPNMNADRSTSDALLKAKSEIATLKHELARSQTQLGETTIRFERKNEELQTEVSNAYQKIDKLESDRKFLMDLQKQLQEKLDSCTKDVSDQEKSFKTEISRLQDSNHELNMHIQDLSSQIDMTSHESALRETQVHNENATLSEQIQELNAQLQLHALLNESKEKEILALEEKLAELEKYQSSAPVAGASEDIVLLRKNASEQSNYITDLQKQIQRMKDDISFYKATHENTSRLREEKTSLEKKLELLSLVSKELNESQVKVAMLESEKQRWLSFFTSLPEGDKLKQNPYELGRVLTQNQATIQVLNEKLERLQERSKVREDYISGLERQIQEAKDKEHGALSQLKKVELQMQRLEQSKNLIQREVDLLRSQLESYSVEEKLFSSSSSDSRKDTRINELEDIIEQQKKQIDMITVELRSAQQAKNEIPSVSQVKNSVFSPEVANVIRELEQKLDESKSEKLLLQKEVESLQNQISVFSNAIPKRDFDPSTTRVLVLADNPESRVIATKKQRLDVLLAENHRLRMELEKASQLTISNHQENTNTVPSSYVPKESLQAKEIECNQLKAELETSEKRLLRLKEVFTTKAQEFRELVASLFGYRMDVGMDGTCKLSHLSGANQGPPISFHVKMDRSSIISFQMAGGSNQLRQIVGAWIKEYLEEKENVPMFLSRFTLEMSSR